MGIRSLLGKLYSTGLGKCLIVLIGACLVLGALLWLEKRANARLSERIGGYEVIVSGQARSIMELRAEREKLDNALMMRESEYADIGKELETARNALRQSIGNDREVEIWAAQKLPDSIRVLVGNSDAGLRAAGGEDGSCAP
ncbi:hypothetical protein LJC48_04525 [Desulfovibrio sp. OttesenSCG-928-C06]|nr:hypothetical protein [Desulfovibrio sp. OttesenSCG-928-C06]